MTIKVPDEYIDFDYGFSGVDDPNEAPPQPTVIHQPVANPELEAKIDDLHSKLDILLNTGTSEIPESLLRDKIKSLEAIIIPLLNNLLKTADKDYIFWPNRKPIIERQIERVLELTRG